MLRERGRASPYHLNATQLVDIMGSEAMFQMGTVANCAEACLDLTMFFDKDTADIDLVPRRLDQFKDVCEFIFARGVRMTYPGHTTAMLQLIKQPRVLHTNACQPKTIGDVRRVSDKVAPPAWLACRTGGRWPTRA